MRLCVAIIGILVLVVAACVPISQQGVSAGVSPGVSSVTSDNTNAHEKANSEFPVSLIQINGSSVIRPCEVGSFAFQLQNPSADDITLDLGASPFGESSFFSQNPAVLHPGDVKTISLFVIPPCEYFGFFPIELVARSKADGRQVSGIVGSLEVSSDGIVEIGKGISRIRVDYNRSGVLIPLHNIGPIDATFTISLDAPSWISVRPLQLSIPAGEAGQVQIISSPADDLEKGSYRATLFAKSAETGVEYGKSLQVVLAPYTPQELFWNKYQLLIVGAGVGLGLIIILILIMVLVLIKTREARRQARLDRQSAKEQKKAEKKAAKDAARLRSMTEKQTRGKQSMVQRIIAWLKKEIISEHALFREDGSRARVWVKPAVWVLSVIIVLIAAGIVLARNWLAWHTIALPWLAGIGVVAIVVILIKLLQGANSRRWRSKFSSEEIEALRSKARRDLEQEFVLVPKYLLSLARQDRPGGLLSVLALVFIAAVALAVVSLVRPAMMGVMWRPLAMAFFVIAIVALMLFFAVRRKSSQAVKHSLLPSVSSTRKVTIKTGWNNGLTEIDVRSKIQKSGVLVTARRHDQSPAFVAPDVPIYQFVEVRVVGLEEKEIDQVGVRFRVLKRWLSKNRATEKDVSLMRYDPARTRWVRVQDLELINVDENWMSFVSKDAGIGLFALGAKQSLPETFGFLGRWFSSKKAAGAKGGVAGDTFLSEKGFDRIEQAAQKRRDREEEKESFGNKAWYWLKYLIIILIIILIIAAVIGMGVYFAKGGSAPAWLLGPKKGLVSYQPNQPLPITVQQRPGDIVGIPDQSWLENTVHSLDLGRFFSDPDKDALVYSHDPVAHIVIEYNGSIARMTPETDFAGETKTVFYATDKQGASAKSNMVRLVVQQGQISLPKQLLYAAKLYAGYIVSGLIALAVIVVSIFLLRRSEDEKEGGE